jgi:hypothetical protein
MYMYRIVINVLKICASSWSLSKVILGCTVNKTGAPVPDAVITVISAPDDGWSYHPKHVEQFTEI